MTYAETAQVDTGPRLEVPARHEGAKAMLLTVIGEFVLPAGGAAWTSSLVAAAGSLGIGEKNARQAIARIGDQGIIEPVRHGRRVRWNLSEPGRALLEDGTRRIYSFRTTAVGWDGEWLLAYVPVAESERAERNQLRNRLGFLGFGELSPSLLVSPHLDREPELRRVLDQLGLAGESIVLHSTAGASDDDAGVVERAWDLDRLAEAYDDFSSIHASRRPGDAEETFRALVELVHAWRRFPFTDPELPTELLPQNWAGEQAARVFRDRHTDWTPAARCWFGELEVASGAEP